MFGFNWAHRSSASNALRNGAMSVAIALGCSLPGMSPAATITVTSLADSGAGTLRAAVASAATVPDAVIDFAVTGTISLTTGLISLGQYGNMTIRGPGATLLTVRNVASNINSCINRVFFGSPGGRVVSLSGMTISGGNVPAGGCAGGAIMNLSTLNLDNVVVSGNVAGSFGGGLMNEATGVMNVTNSTISGNTVGGTGSYNGGGIGNLGVLTLTNSTVSGNVLNGGDGAGGISSRGALTVTNSTITGNQVNNSYIYSAGGVLVSGGSGIGTIRNSIIAGNINNGAPLDVARLDDYNSGTFISSGYNLIGNVGTVKAFSAASQDQTGTGAAPLNPLLGPLTSNGGTTPTHAPLPGSPAIDKGKAFGSTTDQRHFPRPSDSVFVPNAAGGDGSDIGAVEYVAPPPPVITSTTLASGILGVAYSQSVGATLGSPPYTFTVAAGALPPGLLLSTAGVLSGTPTAANAYYFTIQVVDASFGIAQRKYVVVIAPQGSVAYCSMPGLAIPDNSPAGATDTITIPTGSSIADLNVVVAATHPWVGDLTMKLTHVPTDVGVMLLDRAGLFVAGINAACVGSDIPYMVFDDEAAAFAASSCNSVATVQAYPAGAAFRPDGVLANFDGQSRAGAWQLRVSDNAATHTGTFDAWCLVSKNAVTTGLVSSANPSTFGQSVAFTATVSGVAPTGTVNFTDGGTTITGCGAVALSGGTAGCATNTLGAATHPVTAVYSGDVNNASTTSGTLSQVVNKAGSTTALTSSVNPSVSGQSVTLTAIVNSATLRGTMSFLDGAATIAGCGSVAVYAGGAECTTGALAAGSHSLTAVYNGDGNNAGSTSGVLSQSVAGLPDLIVQSITPVPANPTVGQPVTFTVRIKNQGGIAAGPAFNVDFYIDHAPTGCQDFNSVKFWTQGTLAAGATADLVVSYPGFAGVGAHQLYAYADSGCQIAETSEGNNALGPQPITLFKAYTSVTLTSALNPASTGQTVTLTAVVAVTAPGGGPRTGTVAFRDGGIDIAGCAAVPLVGGQAVCAAAGFGVGAHTLTAIYNGDANNYSSTSVVLNQAVSPLTIASALASGDLFTCALRSTGVACWGFNAYGQLGDGTIIDRASPVAALGLGTGVMSITAGALHTCALTSGGAVLCWGNNDVGQLGDNTFDTRLTPGPVSGLPSGVIAITAGSFHTCALISGGAVRCWGVNSVGQLGDNSGADQPVPSQVANLGSGVFAIAAGANHTCALNATGGVLCWGDNAQGQLGDNTTTFRLAPVAVGTLTSGATALTAGAMHTCAVMAGGTAKCWGNNFVGQLGDGTTTERHVPVAVSGLSGVSRLDAGTYHTCALTTGGGVQCWGWNDAGQVGDGSLVNRLLPTAVIGLATGATALSAGQHYTCALTGGGGVKCWGDNTYGQLGDGTNTPHAVPAFVANLNFLGGPALVSSANPSAYGQSTTFTATVTGTTPTGTMNFRDGIASIAGCASVALVAGQASCPTSALAGGARSITAQYSGDANNPGATSVVLTQSVNQTTASVALGTSGTPSKFGQGLTFIAIVLGSTPTGTVTFSDGAHALCTDVALTGNQAQCAANGFTVGGHGIVAVYSGDGNNTGGTSLALTQVVVAASTSAVVALPVNPSQFGQQAQLNATVAAIAPGAGTPTGMVTFKDGITPICGAPLAAGAAQCAIASLASGGHSITVEYGGDANFAASTSGAQVQTVGNAGSTTALVSGTNPSVFGQAVQFTATAAVMVPGVGTPTGTIAINDGAITLCSALAVAGQAACASSALAVGSHGISANYPGDTNLGASTSAPLAQVVNKAGTVTALTAHTPDPSIVGGTITVSASVLASAPGAGVPGGTITVGDGTATCQIALPAASCNLVPVSGGAKTLTAVYSGDGSFNGSSAPGVAHTVNGSATTTLLDSLVNPAATGQNLTFTASIVGSAPTGTVNFKDGLASIAGCGAVAVNGGQAQCATNALGAATHSITAVYGGDADNAGSTSGALQQVVNLAAATTVVLGATGPIHLGLQSTITATVTGGGTAPSGSVAVGAAGGSCNVTLTGGTGTCLLTPTIVGANQDVSGAYGGDDSHALGFGTALLSVKSGLDVDDNNASDPLTDGLLIIRYLFGLTGPGLTNGAIGLNASLDTPGAVAGRLAQILPLLDVDGNGHADALTDGLLIVRYLSGLRGDALIQGAVAANASRKTAELIEAYLGSLLP